mgnify:CR=1 FL=1
MLWHCKITRRPQTCTLPSSSAASDVYKLQMIDQDTCDSGQGAADKAQPKKQVEITFTGKLKKLQYKLKQRLKTVIRLPSFDDVNRDPVLYAHANRVLHLDTNPGNARALVQNQGGQKIGFNPPPAPLTT